MWMPRKVIMKKRATSRKRFIPERNQRKEIIRKRLIPERNQRKEVITKRPTLEKKPKWKKCAISTRRVVVNLEAVERILKERALTNTPESASFS